MTVHLQDPLAAIASTEFSVTQAAGQPSFNTLRAVWRFRIGHAFIDTGDNMTLTTFEGLSQVIIDRGLQLGAIAYHAAAASRIKQPPDAEPVDFGKLVAGMEALNEGGARAASFEAAVKPFPSLPGLFRTMAEGFLEPTLARRDDVAFLVAVFMELISTGFRAEYLFHHLAVEMEEERYAMVRLGDVLRQMLGGDLNTRLGAPGTALRWPTDLQCVCGASLKDFMYCCDVNRPIPVGDLPERPAPEFVIVRPCCGEALPGFRCDRCARLYTWSKGVQ